jgi:hypothetical protein
MKSPSALGNCLGTVDNGSAGDGDCGAECRVAVEHGPFEVAQFLARFDTQLCDQGDAGPPARFEGLRLPPRPVERQCEEPVQPLPERVLVDQRPELPADLVVPAEFEVQAHPVLHRREPGVVQQRGPAPYQFALDPLQRGATPQVERCPQRRRGLRGLRPCRR